MREILFRGKTSMERWNNGRWVTGFVETGKNFTLLHTNPDDPYACHRSNVDPKTVGQFTGLYDKNGKKIFEGDIINCYSLIGLNDFRNAVVNWSTLFCSWRADKQFLYGDNLQIYEIIGNIHDNPELLKEGAQNG